MLGHNEVYSDLPFTYRPNCGLNLLAHFLGREFESFIRNSSAYAIIDTTQKFGLGLVQQPPHHENLLEQDNLDFLYYIQQRQTKNLAARYTAFSILIRENQRAFRRVNPMPLTKTFPSPIEPHLRPRAKHQTNYKLPATQ
ncbi:hypothetical protein QQX98_004473 [Neonectria punicea]|uniref:Uncharacterized protein n=1 Tax=Neonectria punicea TaxID=979145 RepID=A0ABR1H9P6_9HYPO